MTWPRAIGALAVLIVVGCGAYRVAPYRPAPTPGPARDVSGSVLYGRDCGFCHGDEGSGTRNGPALRGGDNGRALTDLVLRTGRMPLRSADEQMRRRPVAYSTDEIEAIVDHVATITDDTSELPDPHPKRGDLARGGELYLENCAACHSTTGIGGAIAQGRQVTDRPADVAAPGLHDSSALEIAEAMRGGPGTMPVFEKELLSDEDVDAIVRYVLYLQEPQDEGGSAIGRIGPVAEGAVGLLVGLGALLLLSRWIGTGARR